VANLNPPHLHLSSRSNFAVNFGVRKLSQGAIVWHYLGDPMFSRYDTIPECDRQTHDDGIYRASMASHVKIIYDRWQTWTIGLWCAELTDRTGLTELLDEASYDSEVVTLCLQFKYNVKVWRVFGDNMSPPLGVSDKAPAAKRFPGYIGA